MNFVVSKPHLGVQLEFQFLFNGNTPLAVKITLSTIADDLGISTATVSLALRDSAFSFEILSIRSLPKSYVPSKLSLAPTARHSCCAIILMNWKNKTSLFLP